MENVNSLVTSFYKQFQDGPVLNLGMGKGIESLFLSKKGIVNYAYDKNPKYVKKLKEEAKNFKLPIKTELKDIRYINFPNNTFSAVLSINVFNFFEKKEIFDLFSKINLWLKSNGIFIFQAFNIFDATTKYKTSEFKYWFQYEDIFNNFHNYKTLLSSFQVTSIDLFQKIINNQYRGLIIYVGKKY